MGLDRIGNSRSAERQKLDVAALQTTLQLMALREVHLSRRGRDRPIQGLGLGAGLGRLVVVAHPARVLR